MGTSRAPASAQATRLAWSADGRLAWDVLPALPASKERRRSLGQTRARGRCEGGGKQGNRETVFMPATHGRGGWPSEEMRTRPATQCSMRQASRNLSPKVRREAGARQLRQADPCRHGGFQRSDLGNGHPWARRRGSVVADRGGTGGGTAGATAWRGPRTAPNSADVFRVHVRQSGGGPRFGRPKPPDRTLARPWAAPARLPGLFAGKARAPEASKANSPGLRTSCAAPVWNVRTEWRLAAAARVDNMDDARSSCHVRTRRCLCAWAAQARRPQESRFRDAGLNIGGTVSFSVESSCLGAAVAFGSWELPCGLLHLSDRTSPPPCSFRVLGPVGQAPDRGYGVEGQLRKLTTSPFLAIPKGPQLSPTDA